MDNTIISFSGGRTSGMMLKAMIDDCAVNFECEIVWLEYVWHDQPQKRGSKRKSWRDAMDLAKERGGDLPTREEQSLLFANAKAKFVKDWYWSNTIHEEHPEWAWVQDFYSGHQSLSHKSTSHCRARAVRRVAIK